MPCSPKRAVNLLSASSAELLKGKHRCTINILAALMELQGCRVTHVAGRLGWMWRLACSEGYKRQTRCWVKCVIIVEGFGSISSANRGKIFDLSISVRPANICLDWSQHPGTLKMLCDLICCCLFCWFDIPLQMLAHIHSFLLSLPGWHITSPRFIFLFLFRQQQRSAP